MSSTADDPVTPPSDDPVTPTADVHPSPLNMHNYNDNVKEENSAEIPTTLPETDHPGFRVDTTVQGGDRNNDDVKEEHSGETSKTLSETDHLGFSLDTTVHGRNNNVKGEITGEIPATVSKTDHLGFSIDTTVHGGDTVTISVENSKPKVLISPNRRNRNEAILNFPPDISRLNINGRPRFELVSVRKNGRLQMFKVQKKNRPQLVRSPVRDGSTKMWLLNDDQHDGGVIRDRVTVPRVRWSI